MLGVETAKEAAEVMVMTEAELGRAAAVMVEAETTRYNQFSSLFSSIGLSY
jgi:hypothetical protein